MDIETELKQLIHIITIRYNEKYTEFQTEECTRFTIIKKSASDATHQAIRHAHSKHAQSMIL